MSPDPGLGPVLPIALARRPEESLESYLERLAAALALDHPTLLRHLGINTTSVRSLLSTLEVAPSGWLGDHAGPALSHVESLPWARLPEVVLPVPEAAAGNRRRSLAAREWRARRGTAICPKCLGATGTWHISWNHPWVTVCTEHNMWLIDTCPSCGLRFRSQRSLLTSVDAIPGTCGNPARRRGLNCRQPLADLAGQAAPNHVCWSQARVLEAVRGERVYVLGEHADPADYLNELKSMTVLLLHLGVRAGGDCLAPWAQLARRDAERSQGKRSARWGLAPPADPILRGLALTSADQILATATTDQAINLLACWLELTPRTTDGQLGWLADHTRMTPRLSRLIMAATAPRRRISTLLDSECQLRIPPHAIPQVVPLPAQLRPRALRQLDRDWDPIIGSYAALSLVRRQSAETTWTGAGRLLGLPPDLATRIARTSAQRATCTPDAWLRLLDEITPWIDPDQDYRQREDTVRGLAIRRRWYARWRRTHYTGSRATSQGYAVTWLWTTWAHGHLDASPGWAQLPDAAARARYRRYVHRLPIPAQEALKHIATSETP